MLTSIVLPSRGRPSQLQMMIKSAREMAVGDLEIIVRLHNDDPAKEHYKREGAEFRDGASAPCPWLWDQLGMSAKGDVIMLAADDFEFMTKGWDAMLREGAPPDGIWVANFGQSANGASCGNGYAMPSLVRDALGYFTAYWFHHWCSDKWLTDIAQLIGRFRPMANIWVQHHKGNDGTRQMMAAQNWIHSRDVAIFDRSLPWREAEAERLRKVMNAGS